VTQLSFSIWDTVIRARIWSYQRSVIPAQTNFYS